MSSTNERIDQLLGDTRRLCMAITDGVQGGYLQDGDGTLQKLVHQVMETSRHVEYDLNADDLAAEDAHLEAEVENDMGDVDL